MHIDRDRVPSSVLDAVASLLASFDEFDRHHAKGLDITKICANALSFVQWCWSLDEDTPLTRDARSRYGLDHPDDIGKMIFAWAFANVQGKRFRVHEVARRLVKERDERRAT